MRLLKRACFAAAFLLASMLAANHTFAASNFKVIHSFKGSDDGEFPEGGVVFDSNGNMYGTTFGALASGQPGKKCPKSCGNTYGFDRSRNLTASYFFQAEKDGAFPTGELLLQSNTLFGTTEYGPGTGCGGLGCGTAYSIPNTQEKENQIFKFCQQANCSDGASPHGSLVADSSGNVFGITMLGGSGNGFLCGSNLGGCGTIFELANGTTKSTLYSFCSQSNCADGAVPYGRLFLDSAGNIYGTTQFGGAFSAGTVFKLTPGGIYTVLHSFCKAMQSGICTDGAVPLGGVIVDNNGAVYGTAEFGGGGSCGSALGCGVAYKLTSSGTYTILHSFAGGTDGAYPGEALIHDSAGNLYSTTQRGGNGPCPDTPVGCGTVFEISAGGIESIRYAFLTNAEGVKPEGTLSLQNDRFLYGATRERGDKKCTCGTLFRIDLQAASPKGLWHSPAVPPGWVDAADKPRRSGKRSNP